MVLRQRSTRNAAGEWLLDPAKLASAHHPLDGKGAVAFHAELANATLVDRGGGVTQVIFDPSVVFTKAITMEDALFALAYHHGELAILPDGAVTGWVSKDMGDRLATFTSRDLAIEP